MKNVMLANFPCNFGERQIEKKYYSKCHMHIIGKGTGVYERERVCVRACARALVYMDAKRRS